MDFVDLALNPRKAQNRFSPFVNRMPEDYLSKLKHRFGDKATADPAECAIYSRDAGSNPAALNMLMKRRAWAVVAPEVRGDLVDVLEFSRENTLPVVPRGGGTSHLGGAVPTEGGIVVDTRNLDSILDVDADAHTVTVEPGITWTTLDDELRDQGLALRQLPLQAHGSTVGGAVARAEAGIGALRYGGIGTDVLEVTLLTPDGETWKLTDEDLDLAVGAWGITGFILEVTLRVRDATTPKVLLATFDEAGGAVEAAERIVHETDAWHLAVFPPRFAELTNDAARDGAIYPKGWSVLATLEEPNDRSRETLTGILKSSGGTLADDEQVQRVWDARHRSKTLKAKGPSLVIAEGILPVTELGSALAEVPDQVKGDAHATWAHAAGPGTVKLIYYGLDDERRETFPSGVGNGLAVLDIVKDHEGHAAGTGVLLSHEAKRVLGKERLKRLKAFRNEHDKEELFNPGPVLGARLRGVPWPRLWNTFNRVNAPILKAARGQQTYATHVQRDPSFQAVNRAVGKVRAGSLGSIEYDVHTDPTDGVSNTHAPETFQARFASGTPEGRVHLARALLDGDAPMTQRVQRRVARSPLGFQAEENHTTGVPVERVTDLLLAAGVETRGPLPEHAVLSRFARERGNVLGKPDKERTAWAEAGYPFDPDARNLIYTDDIAAYEEPAVVSFATRALLNTGIHLTYLGAKEAHAGETLIETGQRQAALDVAQPMMEAILDQDIRRIVTVSANAARAMRNDWPELAKELEDLEDPWDVEVVHASKLLADAIGQGALEFQGTAIDAEDAEDESETAEDEEEQEADDEGAEDEEQEETATGPTPVLLHRAAGLTPDEWEACRTVADAIPAITVVDTLEVESGHGRALRQSFPDLHDEIATAAIEAAKGRGDAEAIVTVTPGDHLSLGSAASGIEVQDLFQLVAEHMVERDVGGSMPAGDISFEEEEEEFIEEDIPDGKFRVEFVKEKMAVPIGPDENILDAAEAYDRLADLPFSCRAGNCDTCSARWEGDEAPDQSQAEALTGEEQEEFVLTCIAKPKGNIKIWSDEAPGR